jgi:hypothetical protein
MQCIASHHTSARCRNHLADLQSGMPPALPSHPIPLQVTLHRQMEKGAREFAEWKRQRDRELLQLKKQGRLNAAQLQKLEALHSKQQAVLRRKTGGRAGVGGAGLSACCVCPSV